MRPHLTPEDLGIDLESDSEGFSLESLSVEPTSSAEELIVKVEEFIGNFGGSIHYAMKRKGGSIYTLITLGEGPSRAFLMDWIRRSP